MSERLAGRVAVITGAAGGIGRAVVDRFVAESAAVALLDLDGPGLTDLHRELEGRDVSAFPCRTDVADEGDVQRALDLIEERFGTIDIVVNSAGLALPGHVSNTAVEDWDRLMATNLRGPFLMIKHAGPLIRRGGSIVNVASVAAQIALPGAAAYCASKGGLVALSRAAAAELAPSIRVNCVCPGTIRSPMSDGMLRWRGAGDIDKGEQITAERYLLDRLGQPHEVAAAVLYLAGEDSSFVTGTTLTVDGGVSAQ